MRAQPRAAEEGGTKIKTRRARNTQRTGGGRTVDVVAQVLISCGEKASVAGCCCGCCCCCCCVTRQVVIRKIGQSVCGRESQNGRCCSTSYFPSNEVGRQQKI